MKQINWAALLEHKDKTKGTLATLSTSATTEMDLMIEFNDTQKYMEYLVEHILFRWI